MFVKELIKFEIRLQFYYQSGADAGIVWSAQHWVKFIVSLPFIEVDG